MPSRLGDDAPDFWMVGEGFGAPVDLLWAPVADLGDPLLLVAFPNARPIADGGFGERSASDNRN